MRKIILNEPAIHMSLNLLHIKMKDLIIYQLFHENSKTENVSIPRFLCQLGKMKINMAIKRQDIIIPN